MACREGGGQDHTVSQPIRSSLDALSTLRHTTSIVFGLRNTHWLLVERTWLLMSSLQLMVATMMVRSRLM